MSRNSQEIGLRFWLVALAIVAVGALSRIVPHPYNFTPLGALALFGGAHLRDRRLAVAVPLLAMLLSDVVLYAFQYPSYVGQAPLTALFVYGSLAGVAGIGVWLQRRRSVPYVAGACVAGSVLFFLVTNLGVWLYSGMYSHTPAGLVACYVAALPFFQNQLAADALFTAALFSVFGLLDARVFVGGGQQDVAQA